jgi:hypothetical protein
VISYHQTQIWYDSKVVLSCHTNRSKQLNFQYIYLISYINEKRQTLDKGSAPIENDITGSELALKYGIHSRNQRSDIKNWAISNPAFKRISKLTSDFKSGCPYSNSRLLQVRDHYK